MKRLAIYPLLALTAATVSCNKFQELAAPMQTDYIRFSTGDGITATGTVETKAMDNEITCDITDWEYVEDSTKTKASLTETLSGSVGVFGYNFTEWGSTVTPTVMYNLKNTVKDGSLTPETKVLWKNYKSGSLRFYAYAPYGKFTLSSEDTGGVPYLTYTVPTTNKEQIDILYAQSADVAYTNRDAVPLQFHHAMTAVQFRLGIDGATLGNVTISGVNSKGQLALDGTWSDQKATASYSVEKIDSLLIMIPQTVPSGAKISLTYNDGTNNNTIEASIAGQVWKAGKKVVYTLKKASGGETDYIYFDLALGNVVFGSSAELQTSLDNPGNNYYGKVMKDGVVTTVSGTHSASNKYYIYQSTASNRASTGWHGSVMTVPTYPSIEVDGKPWKEYITNNTDLPSVISNWKTKALAAGRDSTTNCILVSLNNVNTADIVLDNLWIEYFSYLLSDKGAGGIYSWRSGDIAIGAKAKATNYNSRPVFRLKGDNRLYHVFVPNNGNVNCTFTSEEGDGSTAGTLTAAPSHPFQLIGQGRDVIGSTDIGYSRLGGLKEDANYLYFKGGTFFVSDALMSSNGSTEDKIIKGSPYVSGVIGGGGNTPSVVRISGGNVTALSHSTSAAIGGGGGYIAAGGYGRVEISGGNTYAYSFGVYYQNRNKAVPTTAIGAGGSIEAPGANGIVRISGGHVYAQSVGGCAIGGSNSAGKQEGASYKGKCDGGRADYIQTGGTVIAKSVPGYIYTEHVSQGTAIGGGNGDNGGSAEFVISNGICQTGSVGGGKTVLSAKTDTTGFIGSAAINISGSSIVEGQFIMAKGAATAPTFTITNGILRNSSTSSTDFPKVQPNGGAVYIESGTCSIQGGTISKCSGTLGGAVYMNGGTFEISGTGKISDCNSTRDGGAVYVEGGNVSVSGGEIYHNIASNGNGGGVYITGGNFEMTGGNITSNTADKNHVSSSETGGGNGGGIYVTATDTDPEVKLLDGKIQDNTAELNGGGLCVNMKNAVDHKATITIGQIDVAQRDTISPNISKNSASLYGGGMDVQGKGSDITIYSGTVKGNVSTLVKNEDIRNEGGTVELVGKNDEGKTPQVNVLYNTIKFYANNGVDPEPYDEQRVITSTNSPLRPTEKALSFYKEFFYISSWNTKRDGTGTSYKVDGSGAVMNITEDISLYAQWTQKLVE